MSHWATSLPARSRGLEYLEDMYGGGDEEEEQEEDKKGGVDTAKLENLDERVAKVEDLLRSGRQTPREMAGAQFS